MEMGRFYGIRIADDHFTSSESGLSEWDFASHDLFAHLSRRHRRRCFLRKLKYNICKLYGGDFSVIFMKK